MNTVIINGNEYNYSVTMYKPHDEEGKTVSFKVLWCGLYVPGWFRLVKSNSKVHVPSENVNGKWVNTVYFHKDIFAKAMRAIENEANRIYDASEFTLTKAQIEQNSQKKKVETPSEATKVEHLTV